MQNYSIRHYYAWLEMAARVRKQPCPAFKTPEEHVSHVVARHADYMGAVPAKRPVRVLP